MAQPALFLINLIIILVLQPHPDELNYVSYPESKSVYDYGFSRSQGKLYWKGQVFNGKLESVLQTDKKP